LLIDCISNPVFDPGKLDYLKKMKQNATFCNKPPPLALSDAKFNDNRLMTLMLGHHRIAQIPEIMRSPPKNAIPVLVDQTRAATPANAKGLRRLSLGIPAVHSEATMAIEFRKPREPLVGPGEMDCHAADMTATFSADVPLKVAQAKLAEIDQWIPVDGNPEFTVGRLVEENSTGPLRLGYGAWRDLLLGCQFRIASGELITAGGRTVKNVAGYDLTKFMIGQREIFGSVVTITMRTYRRPAAALLARFDPSDRWISEKITTPLRPRWAILTSSALWCGWLDGAIEIDFFEKIVAKECPAELLRRSLDEDIAHRAKLWTRAGNYFRASVPSTEILKFTQLAKIQDWSADAAYGIVIGSAKPGDFEGISHAARTVGGSATYFEIGKPPQWEATDGEKAILSRLQNAFTAGKGHNP
jgi:hypothetical protein